LHYCYGSYIIRCVLRLAWNDFRRRMATFRDRQPDDMTTTKILAPLLLLPFLLCACGGGGNEPAPKTVQAPPPPAVPAPVPVLPAGPVTLGGAVSSLQTEGLRLVLGDEVLPVPAHATRYAFAAKLARGNAYSVSVLSQPAGAVRCSLQNAAGEVGSVDIADVNLVCRSIQAVATDFAQVGVSGGIAFDPAGAMYLSGASVIRKIAANGETTTIGEPTVYGGYMDGAATAARFNTPMGLAVDQQGNVYVADSGNHAIRKIDPSGRVTTLAGSTKAGAVNGRGSAASFKDPRSVAVDLAGNVYVADTGNYLIRKITPEGDVSSFAGWPGGPGSLDGFGAGARFGAVEAIAIDAQGNLWVADTSNQLIRKITPAGAVRTIAGQVTVGQFADVDGYGRNTRLRFPMAIVADADGFVYVGGNGVVRQIGPDALVSTLAVTGTPGYQDGFASPTPFNFVRGIALDKNGNLYVTEPNLGLVRKLTRY